jgi:competence protein ComEC
MLWRRRARLGTSRETRGYRNWRRIVSIAGLGAALWILVEPWRLLATRPDGTLRVTFLDVGQGDAALVRFPRGATLLIDAGGLTFSSSFDIGDRVVAPVLRHTGIRRLESVALSHGHPDHVGGLSAILREFRPRDVWDGIPVPPLGPLRALKSLADERGARWTTVQTGDRMSIDGVNVIVRHPPPADWERQQVRNDDSVVLELEWHEVSFVFTGDIGAEVEQAIAPRFAPMPLRVLKVPHHGSLTSSSRGFVSSLQPRIAVVSAGRGNIFGHPAPAVLGRYREIGADVFRTDRDGAVTIETDGHSLSVSTFTGRRLTLVD